jgi:hypothetical protein
VILGRAGGELSTPSREQQRHRPNGSAVLLVLPPTETFAAVAAADPSRNTSKRTG